MRLSREAPDPLYVQLKETLVGDIRAGRYRMHQRLPSERDLSNSYKVSRMTVRQALLELAHDGAIYTRAGKGTFVAPPKIDQQLRTLTGFTEDVRARGATPSSRVLDARIRELEPAVVAALRLAPGATAVVITRIRLADNLPLAVETSSLPAALCPGLLEHDFERESLYGVLRGEFGLVPTLAEQTIEAALATPRECQWLELSPPAPVLRIQRLTYASDGMPLEYVASTYRGDRYKLSSVLQAGSGRPSQP